MKSSILNVVDFDETLFRVPGFTSANFSYNKPYDWFDSPESLSLDKHRMQLIESVNKKLLLEDTNIILSHRVKRVEPGMLLLIHKFNISEKFNQIILCERGISKPQRLIEYIKEMQIQGHTFEKIRIFEDSLVQLDAYARSKDLADLGYSFEYWFVDKTELLKINSFTIDSRERLELNYI